MTGLTRSLAVLACFTTFSGSADFVAADIAAEPTRKVQERVGGEKDLQARTYDAETRIVPPRDPHRRNRWRLGVSTDRAPLGVRFSRVYQGTAAWQFGLERGDYLLDVAGYPIGDHQGRFYSMSDALNEFVGSDGWVNLLVWDHRSRSSRPMWVRLQRRD